MSNDREQPEMDDATLDALLGEARWPDATPSSTRRLEQYWHTLQRPSNRRGWLLAASLLLAAGAAVIIVLAHWNATPIKSVATDGHQPIVDPILSHREIAPRPVQLAISRAPTALELVQFTAEKPRRRRVMSKVPAADVVERAVTLLASSGAEEDLLPAAATILVGVEPREREIALYRTTRSSDPAQSQAAAQLLTEMGTASSVPMLLDLYRDPGTRLTGIEGLSRVANPDLLGKLARANTDLSQQRMLIAGVIRSGRTSLCLDLVTDRATARATLLALDDVPNISTDPFFAALYDPHVSVRLAAAKVLGHVDGPATTARLVAMTEQNQNRREALIALADSRGPEARQYISTARRSSPLGAIVQSILTERTSNP